MRRNVTAFHLAAAAVASLLTAAPAEAVDVDFTFADDGAAWLLNRGHVPGTVSGTLFGLVDDATSVPTSLRISQSPDALGYSGGIYTGFAFDSPGITLVNGRVTAADMIINFTANGSWQLRFTCNSTVCGLNNGNKNVNALLENGVGAFLATGNSGGFGGVTWGSLVAPEVPEPSAWAAMIAGFAVLGAASRRRRARSGLRPA